MSRQRQVGDYMTVAPHFIGLEQSIEVAARRMRELRVRHLPVLHGGVLRGIVSQRDIALVQAIDVDPRDITVEEAMAIEPYTVPENAPLTRVAREMAAHKYGCAVVVEHGHVKGIFTTTDGMRALADVLEELGPEQSDMLPSQVRSVILSEHTHLRRLLDHTESQAQRILTGGGFGDDEVHALRDAARRLYTSMGSHMELENRVLAPALAQIDAFGQVRSERLVSEHRDQLRGMEAALMELDDLAQPPAALAASVGRLVDTIRRDMDLEEEALLNEDLLRDDPVAADAETG